jgi:hypothetical protein
MKAFLLNLLWKGFRVRFDVDPRLKSSYRKVKVTPCCHGCKGTPDCVTYVSCGPVPGCHMPCPACLFWTGYGLKNDIDGKCKDWCVKNLGMREDI